MLLAVAEAWEEQRDEVERSAAHLAEHIRSGARLQPSPEPLGDELLAEAQRNLRDGFDWQWGGWGRAPKFPPAPVLEFLLRRGEEEMTPTHARRDDRSAACTTSSAAASTATPSTSAGSCRTSRRCSTTTRCSRRSTCTRRAASATSATGGSPSRRSTTCCASSRSTGGGFASAQDADTDGVEGLTFTWAPGEGAPDELLQPFEHGRFVLRGELDERDARAALRAARAAAEAAARRQGDRLLERPDARCARGGGPRRAWRRALARRSCSAPLSTPDGRLHRTWRDGVAKGTGYLEDYADVAYGLIELHVATGELRWLREAHRLARLAVDLFADDEDGGFFQAPRDGEQLVARKKELDDHPTPSGNAMLAYVLLRLPASGATTSSSGAASRCCGSSRDALTRAPSAFGWVLVALDLYLAPHREIAIVGPPDAPVARAALARCEPTDVIAFGPGGRHPAARRAH